MELEECIKDAVDASMQKYSNSEAYLDRRAVLDANITSFKSGLDQEQSKSLEHILDQLSTEYGLCAAEAYKNGVVEGIALRAKVVQE